MTAQTHVLRWKAKSKSYSRTHAHACTHTPTQTQTIQVLLTHTRARMHTHTHTNTNTYIQVICIALTPNDGSDLRAEVEGKVEVFVDLTPDLALGLPVAAQKVNRYNFL
jgi:hypothetical protein